MWRITPLIIVAVIACATATAIGLYFDDPIAAVAERGVITPIAFVAATLANATAVGGGFLFFPLFVYLYALSPVSALKLSLATQAFGMSSGALGWSRKFIDKTGFVTGSSGGLTGLAIGTFVWQIPSAHIKPFFGWISIVFFFVILAEIKLGTLAHNSSIDSRNLRKKLGLLFTAFCGGLVTAWAAIGVGEFIALYMLLAYRVKFQVSVGTGVAVLAVCSIAGLLFHINLGGIPWDYLIFTAPGVMLGGYTGAWIGRNIHRWRLKASQTAMALSDTTENSASLKWIFSIVVLIDGVSILVNHYLF
ncbi:sulfite exporter TauE/SafE family protein [Halioxenophilus sp. WMMB6]|uniref:sulfite exporter TauE/SafE family protein n=1 Tax=Halioxenophilus sp. WMMB6 TaxID=3073815 RepID=UPI00295EBDC4|nr:sulfite exporter TauE/SafE family protein [Halioxenophilus sp. WMMB6]